MATKLTQEQIQHILSGGQYYDGNGRAYAVSKYGDRQYQSDNQQDFSAGPAMEIAGYDWKPGQFSDNTELNGRSYTKYNLQGDETGTGTFDGLGSWYSSNPLLAIGGILAAPFAASALGLGGGAAGGAAGGGAGYGALGATEPITSLAMGGGGTGAMGAAGAGAAGAGAAGGAGAATGGGLLSGIGSAIKDNAGLLAAGIGAAAGAQGQENETTNTRRTDPRVDPYLFGAEGQPGLLQYAMQQLNRDMSPDGRAGYESMKSKGMGLLNQPVAGNGFGLFTKGRY